MTAAAVPQLHNHNHWEMQSSGATTALLTPVDSPLDACVNRQSGLFTTTALSRDSAVVMNSCPSAGGLVGASTNLDIKN
jgi:hypothetical protein